MLGPTLETPRLILRPPTLEDFDAYASFMADPSVAHFLGGEPQPRAVAWRGFAQIVGSWSLRGFSMFSILDKATGRWLGRAGPWSPEGWPGLEVGWGIAPFAQRQGYATEAASAAIDWVFEELEWPDVIHCIEPENTPSIAVARALGSGIVRPGVASPPPYHVTWDLYGQTRDEWRARHPRGSIPWQRVQPGT